MSAFDPNSPEQAGETGNAADYPFDLVFLDAMAGHHAGSVAMAQVALDRSERPEIRDLASAIVAANDAEIVVLRGWRAAWYAEDDPVPANVVTGLIDEGLMTSGAMGGMGRGSVASDTGLALARLCSQDGPFDLAFLTGMIPHLQGSTGIARLATERSDHAELTPFAGEIVTAQEQWLTLMSGWQAEWYPQGPTGAHPDSPTPVAGTPAA